jgi:hypothetical protein
MQTEATMAAAVAAAAAAAMWKRSARFWQRFVGSLLSSAH